MQGTQRPDKKSRRTALIAIIIMQVVSLAIFALVILGLVWRGSAEGGEPTTTPAEGESIATTVVSTATIAITPTATPTPTLTSTATTAAQPTGFNTPKPEVVETLTAPFQIDPLPTLELGLPTLPSP